MEKKLVLFDWNGTLLDDVPFSWSAFVDTFYEFGGEPPSMKEFFQELKRDYYDIYTSRGITASREELYEVYAPLYADLVEDVVLYPHVAETLETLSDLNIPIGLITMQQEELASPVLTAHGISHHFSSLSSFHDLQKAETITAFCKKVQVEPGNCFFVGDSPSDIRHASRAGVNSVAFMNGYVPKDLIAEADPDFAIRDIGDVVELVFRGSYRGMLCDGCNVLGGHQHRCHHGDLHIFVQGEPAGQHCSCQTCRTGSIIFDL